MDLSDILITKALFPGESGGGSCGGIKLLKAIQDDGKNVFPAGSLGEYAYCRIWDDVPTSQQLAGGVFCCSSPDVDVHTYEIQAEKLVDLTEDAGAPILAWMVVGTILFFVLKENVSNDGFTFEAGIYVSDQLYRFGTLTVLAYNL